MTATDGGLLGTEGADLGRGAAAGAKAGDIAVGEDETVSDGLRRESDPALTTEVTEAVDGCVWKDGLGVVGLLGA